MEIALVFPHQLFDPHPALAPGRRVLLIEDPLFFGNDRHWPLRFHAQKLVLHRASMTHWMRDRNAAGHHVIRTEPPAAPTTTSELLREHLPPGVTALHVCDVVDDVLSRRLLRFAQSIGAELIVHETPMFLTPLSFVQSQLGGKKKPFMAAFYQAQRKRMGVLIEPDGSPTGGQWSFDADNRQRLPKGHQAPDLPTFAPCPILRDAMAHVAERFPQARGSFEHFRWPVTRAQALTELHAFLHERLTLFGHYEDFISTSQPWLYHSMLTPALNIGLIAPQEVVEQTLAYAASHAVPLNSLEGFIRQIIGWREFMRGIYHLHGTRVRNGNFFQHHEPLPESFHEGTTGSAPIDAVIQQLHRHAWCHHIERLMVIGNTLVLRRIDPHSGECAYAPRPS